MLKKKSQSLRNNKTEKKKQNKSKVEAKAIYTEAAGRGGST